MQIIELYIKTGGVNSTGTAFNVNTLIDYSLDFTDFDISVDDSIYFPDLDLTSSITSITSNNITISSNILTPTEITKYEIGGVFNKLDLFKDESVSITDSIKNLKDPSKIFTAFSQQFSVPASKNNSKIFGSFNHLPLELIQSSIIIIIAAIITTIITLTHFFIHKLSFK